MKDSQMPRNDASQLYEVADRILAIGRHLRAPANLEPGPCSPVEITVMRHVNQHPGATARAAADATLLPSSNLSRTLRSLEEKGLIRRETDERDTRSVRLYPTSIADQNIERLRKAWSEAIAGAFEDTETVKVVSAALQRIEAQLISQAANKSPTD